MDSFLAVMAAIGILTTSYGLGYPIEWLATHWVSRSLSKFQSVEQGWRKFNHEYDERNS
jgi:hypothetical protein